MHHIPRYTIESYSPRLDGLEVLLLGIDFEPLCKRYILKVPETGTIIELEANNWYDIKLESDDTSSTLRHKRKEHNDED
nr:MAG TPA: hypothetical protein [Caudoviricetes sp.]